MSESMGAKVKLDLKEHGEPKMKLSATIKKDFIKNKWLYLLVLPVIAYYVIFHYVPMYGAVIAFKDFNPRDGILFSEWVGLANFKEFWSSYYFWRLLKNTLVISVSGIIFGFPVPIIFALLLNEVKSKRFTKAVQTVTYMPHFISMVVICSMIKCFTADTGFVSGIVSLFTGQRASLLNNPNAFVPIYTISGIWQEFGWGSIVYLSALMGIDQDQYEAARIDGANRWHQAIYITLPGLVPTIVVLFILRMGSLLTVGFEKIILLYSQLTYSTADVISSFVYRKGILESNWSYSAAVGLFNSVINFVLLFSANMLSRKMNETSLW